MLTWFYYFVVGIELRPAADSRQIFWVARAQSTECIPLERRPGAPESCRFPTESCVCDSSPLCSAISQPADLGSLGQGLTPASALGILLTLQGSQLKTSKHRVEVIQASENLEQ